jgi:hypothetical protein
MLLTLIEQCVYINLQRAQVVSLVQNPRDDIEREGYWEHSFIVTWSRPVEGSEPSPDDNGYTYGTHRVHINSTGDAQCYDGHYRMPYLRALDNMFERARIGVSLVTDKDKMLALWFTPDAVTQHFDGDNTVLAKAVCEASDKQLRQIGEGALGGDFIYREFHEGLRMAAEDVLGIEHNAGQEEIEEEDE